jgi:hypothetical protein
MIRLRQAAASQLPARWQPGQPLPARIKARLVEVTCPWGSNCIRCKYGERWNEDKQVHVVPPGVQRIARGGNRKGWKPSKWGTLGRGR